MTSMIDAVSAEKMTILGDVGAAPFLPWIRRHARKLGLKEHIAYAGPDRIEIDITGPADLIDAMEMGCSLGPIEVWVEAIVRAPAIQTVS